MSSSSTAWPELREALVALAPVVLVMVVALELAIHAAWSPRAQSSTGGGHRLATRLGVGGLVVVGALSLVRLGDAELDAGLSLFGGAVVVDHLSDLLDLVLVGITAAALSLGAHGGRGRRLEEPLLAVLGCLGAMVVVHAGHLGLVFVGLELVALTGVVLAFAGDRSGDAPGEGVEDLVDRRWMPSLVASAFLLMGLALVQLGLSTLSLDELGDRASVAFNRWASVQPYLDLLEADDPAVPAGLIVQARGKVVGGMAPVSSFLAGLVLLLIGMLARIGAAPFPAVGGGPRLAGGATRVCATALIPVLAVLAAMLRLLVGSLHAPQLVREPYGWASLIVVVGSLTTAHGAWIAGRATMISELIRGLMRAQLGLLLTGVALTAGFYGHRRGLASQLSSRTELDWSQVTGDAALAALLLLILVWAIATVGLLAAAELEGAGEGGDSLVGWSGLARRRPALGLALAVCLGALGGLPLTGGFLARATYLRTMLQHSSFTLASLVLVLLTGALAWVCVRQIARIFAGEGSAEEGSAGEGRAEKGRAGEASAGVRVDSESASTRARGRVGALLLLAAALALPALGAGEAVVMGVCRDAAAGASMAPGLRARGVWVRRSRERASGDPG